MSSTAPGAILDKSQSKNHGTLNQVNTSALPVFLQNGKVGGAYRFDGEGASITAKALDFIRKNGTYTFSAWVKYDGKGVTTGNTGVVFQNSFEGSDRCGASVSEKSATEGTFRFGYYNGSGWVGKSGTINKGEWSHVVAVNDAGVLALYIDGIVQTSTGNPYVSVDAATLYIGRNSISSHNYDPFKGDLDNIQFYNKALSASQAQSLFSQGYNGAPTYEACDDGNTVNGDGCSSTCSGVDEGWICNGTNPSNCNSGGCGDGIIITGKTAIMACPTPVAVRTTPPPPTRRRRLVVRYVCQCTLTPGQPHFVGKLAALKPMNNAIRVTTTATTIANRCRTDCTQYRCGDGVIDSGETCDDGNSTSGDGCNAQCQLTPGWECTTPGQPCCAAQCGDGIPASGNPSCPANKKRIAILTTLTRSVVNMTCPPVPGVYRL